MASPQNQIQIEINVRISQPNYYGGQIHLSETLQVPDTDFLGLAAIMKRFHDLAEELSKAKRDK